MAGYGIAVEVDGHFSDVVARTRAALASEGFGVLTEIDVAATMKAKLGAELEPYLILGACNPTLAYAALQREPSIGLLLPCNVVVRQVGDHVSVEAMDPAVMVDATSNPALAAIADDARARLTRALEAFIEQPSPSQ